MALNAYILGSFVGSLFDEGFANVIGLQTLRDRTNPLDYFSIRHAGADPDHCGKTTSPN